MHKAVIPLAPNHLVQAGEVMGRAFADDPLMAFFMPEPGMRERYLAWYLQMSVDYGLRYGLVYTTPDGVKGTAVWLRPGHTTITPWRMVRVGAARAIWRLGLGNLQRMLTTVDHFERLALAALSEPYWHLMSLGVDPVHQGTGIGGTLIAPVLSEADAAGRICYLETTKARNLPFYERHGFQVVQSGTLPADGPAYWTMKRPPANKPPTTSNHAVRG